MAEFLYQLITKRPKRRYSSAAVMQIRRLVPTADRQYCSLLKIVLCGVHRPVELSHYHLKRTCRKYNESVILLDTKFDQQAIELKLYTVCIIDVKNVNLFYLVLIIRFAIICFV